MSPEDCRNRKWVGLTPLALPNTKALPPSLLCQGVTSAWPGWRSMRLSPGEVVQENLHTQREKAKPTDSPSPTPEGDGG